MAWSCTLFYAHVTVMLPPSSARAHVTQEWKIVSAGHALLPLTLSASIKEGRNGKRPWVGVREAHVYSKVLSEGANRLTDRCPELPEYIIHILQDLGIIDGAFGISWSPFKWFLISLVNNVQNVGACSDNKQTKTSFCNKLSSPILSPSRNWLLRPAVYMLVDMWP